MFFLGCSWDKMINNSIRNETGFDVEDTSVDGRDDIEGLDASAAHVANLLSSEPSDGTYITEYAQWKWIIDFMPQINQMQIYCVLTL
jgi:hypothetical protein